MAETTATRPSRARKATTTAKATPAKTTAAKTTTAKAAPVKQEAENVTRFKVELEHAGDTKSYSKFVVPDNLKGTCVGSIYAPLGTERVVILVAGPGDSGED